MPPPIPLSGAAAWYSAGSQSGSAKSSAKCGRIRSQASAGEELDGVPPRIAGWLSISPILEVTRGPRWSSNCCAIRRTHSIIHSKPVRLVSFLS